MAKRALSEELTKILASSGVIAPAVGEQLGQLFEDSTKEDFTEFLLEEGFIEKQDLLDALSKLYQVPAFDAEGYLFDHPLVHRFPKGFLLRNNIIPIEVDDDEEILLVATSDPENEELLPLIGEWVSWDIQFNVGLKRHINDAVQEFHEAPVTEVPEDEDWQAERRLAKVEEDIEENGDESFDDEE